MEAADGGFRVGLFRRAVFLLRIRLSASTDIEKNMAK